MPYACFNPSKLAAKMYKHRGGKKAVLYFFIDNSVEACPYRPATQVETKSSPCRDGSEVRFETDGLVRIPLYTEEVEQLVDYFRRQNPDMTIADLDKAFTKSSNGKRELQNCFGFEKIWEMQHHRLPHLIDSNKL